MSSPRPIALIADDHELFRAGCAALLRQELGFAEIIEASSFDEAIECLQATPVSLASFDLNMPGLDTPAGLQRVREQFPGTHLAVISASEKREDILQAIGAGSHGYIPKTLRMSEIVRALQLVLEGQVYVPASLVNSCSVAPAADCGVTNDASDQAPKLTIRQSEVVRLMAEGKSNKHIARELHLAEGTVKVHVNALFRALGVHNRVSAVGKVRHYDRPPKG